MAIGCARCASCNAMPQLVRRVCVRRLKVVRGGLEAKPVQYVHARRIGHRPHPRRHRHRHCRRHRRRRKCCRAGASGGRNAHLPRRVPSLPGQRAPAPALLRPRPRLLRQQRRGRLPRLHRSVPAEEGLLCCGANYYGLVAAAPAAGAAHLAHTNRAGLPRQDASLRAQRAAARDLLRHRPGLLGRRRVLHRQSCLPQPRERLLRPEANEQVAAQELEPAAGEKCPALAGGVQPAVPRRVPLVPPDVGRQLAPAEPHRRPHLLRAEPVGDLGGRADRPRAVL
mmetsp:Transcript_13114/g.33364  ORF Transcript_13114/g.33364 Transcript_13114/m.33364 type:complete len:282 (+) Transcript_13114:158-1003(+)